MIVEFSRRGVTPSLAATLRRWARVWLAAVVAGLIAFVIVRLAWGGPTVHDWEPLVWPAASIAVVAGAAIALRWEGLGAMWILLLAVAGGVLLSAHYGPVIGFTPVVALVPAAVLLILAWQHVRTVRAITAFGVVLAVVLAAGGYGAFAAYDAVFGPSHPASSTPSPSESPVEWMWAGAVDTHGFTVVGGVDAAGPASLVVADAAAGPWRVAAVATPDDRGVVRFEVAGFAPATAVFYAIETETGRGPVAEVATLPDGAADLTIVFSSCARIGSNGAVFDTMRDVDADLYVITGDLFYGDIGPNDPDAFRAAYVETLTRPAQSALYRSVPIAYMWDDHDYSQNDADASAPSRPAAMSVYREMVPHYPLAGDDAPIYQAFTIGRVRVIMTDTRSARSVDEGSALGADQLGWLETELESAAGRYPVVIWVNPDPWIAAAEPGADHWGGYPDERARVARLIDELDFGGFLMLAGDAHMLAIDDGSHNTYGGGDGFPVFHAGALDRPGSEKGGPYSEGAFPGGGQFGVVEITDDGTTIEVTLSGRDWEGAELVSYRFVVAGGQG